MALVLKSSKQIIPRCPATILVGYPSALSIQCMSLPSISAHLEAPGPGNWMSDGFGSPATSGSMNKDDFSGQAHGLTAEVL